jgi:hypothetical protein
MAGKRTKRARAAVATSIVAAASLAGVGTAVAAEPISGPEVCKEYGPTEVSVVLADHVYQKWDSLAEQGVFIKMEDAFIKMDDVFFKIEAAVPVEGLFIKIDGIDGESVAG